MKTRSIFLALALTVMFATAGHALTVEEILLLKRNGVSETTIQMMLQSEMRAHSQAAEPDAGMGIKRITRPDGKAAIVYSTGNDDGDQKDAQERLKEERAWQMLQHLLIDARGRQE